MDSDYAENKEKRHSNTGYLFCLHNGPVAWTSREKSCTALSTTEAEYIYARLPRKQLGSLEDTPVPILLLSDSISAIKLVKNTEFHQRTKHIGVKYHFISEQ